LPLYAKERQMILSLPRLPSAARAPRSLEPDPSLSPWVTVGWLVDTLHEGRAPAPRPLTRAERAEYQLRLSVQELDGGRNRVCQALRRPLERTLQRGDAIDIHGVVAVRSVAPGQAPSPFVTYGTQLNALAPVHRLVAVASRVRLRVVARSRDAAAC